MSFLTIGHSEDKEAREAGVLSDVTEGGLDVVLGAVLGPELEDLVLRDPRFGGDGFGGQLQSSSERILELSGLLGCSSRHVPACG